MCICMFVCVFLCVRACGPHVIIRRKEKRRKDSKLLAAIAVHLLQPRFKIANLIDGATRLTTMKEITPKYSHTHTCSTSDIESRNPLNLYLTHLLVTRELQESERRSRRETERERENERDKEIARETCFLSFFFS